MRVLRATFFVLSIIIVGTAKVSAQDAGDYIIRPVIFNCVNEYVEFLLPGIGGPREEGEDDGGQGEDEQGKEGKDDVYPKEDEMTLVTMVATGPSGEEIFSYTVPEIPSDGFGYVKMSAYECDESKTKFSVNDTLVTNEFCDECVDAFRAKVNLSF